MLTSCVLTAGLTQGVCSYQTLNTQLCVIHVFYPDHHFISLVSISEHTITRMYQPYSTSSDDDDVGAHSYRHSLLLLTLWMDCLVLSWLYHSKAKLKESIALKTHTKTKPQRYEMSIAFSYLYTGLL